VSAGLLWLLAGVIVCGAEMLLPSGGYLLWIGLAACGAGLLTEIAGLGFTGQVIAFLALLAIVLGALQTRRRGRPLVNVPDDEMLGRTCRAIAFQGLEGRVRVGDGSWQARATGAQPDPDALMRVVGREGTTLLVTPVQP
jgi:membrane protein implicated in regulation of membrane protease activity